MCFTIEKHFYTTLRNINLYGFHKIESNLNLWKYFELLWVVKKWLIKRLKNETASQQTTTLQSKQA